MSTTLTYGRKVPSSGERGFWEALEDNIERDDAHDHDGLNSKKLKAKNFDKDTSTISSDDWDDQGGGTYKQTITLPSGYSMATVTIWFIITSTGHPVFPTVEKVSNTSYDVYINDNSIGLTAIYG